MSRLGPQQMSRALALSTGGLSRGSLIAGVFLAGITCHGQADDDKTGHIESRTTNDSTPIGAFRSVRDLDTDLRIYLPEPAATDDDPDRIPMPSPLEPLREDETALAPVIVWDPIDAATFERTPDRWGDRLSDYLEQVSPFRAMAHDPRLTTTETTSPFRVEFGRDTALIDGGFGTPAAPDEIASPYIESPGERFERFNLDLEWTPMARNASIQWLVLSGVQAVRADISRLDSASLALNQARGLVAVPMIGTGVRWQPTDGMVFSTTAATQSIEQSAGVLDLSFNAEFRLSRTVGLTAGYEIFESDMVVDDLRTSLDREGVFAKLTIRF